MSTTTLQLTDMETTALNGTMTIRKRVDIMIQMISLRLNNVVHVVSLDFIFARNQLSDRSTLCHNLIKPSKMRKVGMSKIVYACRERKFEEKLYIYMYYTI